MKKEAEMASSEKRLASSALRTLRNEIEALIKEKYGAEPEHLWMRWPDYAVFRHADNGKWFGIIMDIPRAKLGLDEPGWTDVLNVKAEPALIELLIHSPGFFRGYHLSKGNWLSVLLDGTVGKEQIGSLLEGSYFATASAKEKQRLRAPKEWIVPANPEHYDIVHAFDSRQVIEWKQARGAKTGDTVFIYAGAPVSAILYKTVVTETDIPYDFRKEGLTITALMRLRLERRYPPERFTFKELNDRYGIFAVRGPRGIPEPLSRDLEL